MTITTVVEERTAGPDVAEINQEVAAEQPEQEQTAPESAADVADNASDQEENTEDNSEGEHTERARPSGFKRRIQKFEKQIEQARLEAEFWREQALKSQPAATATTPDPAQEEPRLTDFDSVESYVRARDQWLIDRVLPEKVKNLAQQAQADAQKVTAEQAMIDSYKTRVREVQQELPDYLDVVQDLPDLPLDMQEFLISSELGPRLTYQLAQNPEQAERLIGLSPVRRLAELGKLELAAARPSAPQKRITQAPPVAPRVKGEPAPVTTIDTATARTFQEFKAIRLKQLQDRRR